MIKKTRIKEKFEDLPDFNNFIEASRWILKNHQALTIDDVLIDASSANAITIVYDALNEKNQEKAIMLPVQKFAKYAWGMVE